MMSEFLLEIYGEEIPSSTQNLLELELKRLFEELLKRFDIKFEKNYNNVNIKKGCFIL